MAKAEDDEGNKGGKSIGVDFKNATHTVIR